MPGKSDFLENQIIDVLFRGQSATIGGKTLSWAAGAPKLYVGLGTAEADTGLTELSTGTGSYARAALAAGAAQALTDMKSTQNDNVASTGTTGQTSNTNTVTFPTATADWNSAATIGYFGIFDAASGGNLLYSAALTTARAVTNGTTASFAAGAITVTEG
jgi:hypothetical protein